MANTNALGMIETKGLVGAIGLRMPWSSRPMCSWWDAYRWAEAW